MGFDNIKPLGNQPPVTPPSAETASAKPDRSFAAAAKEKLQDSDPQAGASSPLAAQFNKADLQDPARVDQMVRSSVSEMVDSQGMPGPLSTDDKASLVDFLSGDPLIRQQVESYMRKVLP